MKRVFATLVVALAAAACVPMQKATGEIEERTIAIEGNIEAVAISSGFDVVVDATLPDDQMVVKTHSDMFDKLEIEVEDSVLSIGLGNYSLHAETLEARIPSKNYTSIAASAGADFDWSGCDVGELTIAVSAGADIEIEGRCTTLTIAASAGADADLDELVAANVSAVASSGAGIDVCATESLSAGASSGADICYSGEPKEVNINTSSGGSVHRR